MTTLTLHLPDWLRRDIESGYPTRPNDRQQMEWALELSRRNVVERTGGPFGAAVFELGSGRAVSCGVNLVERERCSLAHAEVIALMLAQKTLGTFDLGAAGGRYALVSSAMPCVQCFGAIWWSGISRLVVGARAEDVERAGFREGPVPPDWAERLEGRAAPLRPVAVARDVLRQSARDVIDAYARDGGSIYNPS